MARLPFFTPSSWSVAASLSFTLGALGCDNPIDTSPNVLPEPLVMEAGESMSGATGGETQPDQCASCVEVGSWYRFDLLQLEALDGGIHPVIGVLNSLWRADISSHVLNVLFEVREIDGDQIKMGAMNAAWLSEAEDDYCVLPSTAIEFVFTRSECQISNPAPAGINIYAGSQEIPKNCSPDGGDARHAIPVRKVSLSGSFDSECQTIGDGVVQGAAIKRSALEQTCSCLNTLDNCGGPDANFMGDMNGECAGCNVNYTSLARPLNLFKPLEWNCEIDGEQAVCIEATFSATRLNFTPPVCP